MTVLSPDCRDENCGKCNGIAWDLEQDAETACQCECNCSVQAAYEADLDNHSPEVEPDAVKWPKDNRLPVKANGKVVGYAEGPDIVITDKPTMDRIRDLGRLHVSIGPLDASPIVSELFIRPKD